VETGSPTARERAIADLNAAFRLPETVSFVLTVVEARNLPIRPGAEYQTYCTIETAKQPLLSTAIVKNKQSPVWNAEFPLRLWRKAEVTVKITLLGFTNGSKAFPIGELVLRAVEIGQKDGWVEMAPASKRLRSPELHLIIDIIPAPHK
jgi:hypothetical protein